MCSIILKNHTSTSGYSSPFLNLHRQLPRQTHRQNLTAAATGRLENVIANPWSRQRITKKAHTDHGIEPA